jgi:hypothetical protein
MTQKVLGLDLSKVTMPEAIAAMVEAWLDAQQVQTPDYIIEHENKTYYDWFNWMQAKRVNRQTFIALARAAFGTDWDISIPTVYSSGYRGEKSVITAKQAIELESFIDRRSAGESMEKLKKELKQKLEQDLKLGECVYVYFSADDGWFKGFKIRELWQAWDSEGFVYDCATVEACETSLIAAGDTLENVPLAYIARDKGTVPTHAPKNLSLRSGDELYFRNMPPF